MSAAERLFLLAPGAGAPSTSPWMLGLATRLAPLGRVERFDYPYQLAGRGNPDRHDVLVAAHARALADARAHHAGPVVLVGKSMGGRIGCHVAVATEDKPEALVCLGYPLAGRNQTLRDQVLRELTTPVLFVQGTRDALCPLDRLDAVRREMTAENRLFVVEDGDHSLAVAKRTLTLRGDTQAAADARVIQAIAEFLAALPALA